MTARIGFPWKPYQNQRYTLGERLAAGGCALIYEGTDYRTTDQVALKLEDIGREFSLVWHEWDVYQEFRKQETTGIAKAIEFLEEEGQFRVLILPLLGSSLQQLLEDFDDKFCLKTTLLLADQLLCRLKTLHKLGIVHRDIHPGNCVLGLERKSNVVHLVDFGISVSNIQGGVPSSNTLLGTRQFASRSGHHGDGSSPYDDLESLAYMLISFQKELPWTWIDQYDKCLQQKVSVPPSKIAEGLDTVFADFLSYAKQRPTEKPDYGQWRRRFASCFRRRGFKYGHDYEWTDRGRIEHGSEGDG